MAGYLRLVRLGNVLVSLVGTVVGGVAAAGVFQAGNSGFWLLLVLASLSTATVTAGGNVLNDLLDREPDRVNHPDRPLVTGAVTPANARTLATVLLVASALLVVPVVLTAPLVGAILGVALAVLLSYEFRLKSSGLVGNLSVALLTGLVFLYGGAAVGDIVPVLPFAGMAFLATLGRELVKDMEDVRGDVGRRTLPRVWGMPITARIARLAVGAAIALSVVPILTYLSPLSVAGIMYLALVAAADVLFVLSVYWLPGRLHLEQQVSKGAMTVALLAFLAVAFR